MKMNEVFIDMCNVRASGLAILRKNSHIRLFLAHNETITKDKLNNHEKRLFNLFEKKVKYLRSINKNIEIDEIEWENTELISSGKIYKNEIDSFWYEEYDKQTDYRIFKPFIRYNKAIIVTIETFNNLEVSF